MEYCRKLPLKSVLTEKEELLSIQSLVLKINTIIRETLQFTKLYFLKYPDVECNRAFFKKVFSLVSRQKRKQPKTFPEKLKQFYDEEYATLQNQKLDGSKIRHVLDAEITQIVTNIKNHVTTTFFEQINALAKTENTERKQLRKLRTDLLNDTRTSEERFHAFLERWGPDSKQAFSWFKRNPFSVLPFLLRLNSYLEEKEAATFALIPLRTSFIPCYIMLGPSILNESFPDSKGLWEKWTMRIKSIIKSKKGTVISSIRTDGIGCSVFFKPEDQKWGRKKKVKEKLEEYIDDLSQFEDLKGKKVVAIDPNKGNLVYCFDGEKTLRYTQSQRRKETKKNKYKQIRKEIEEKSGLNVQEMLNELRETPRKTVQPERFSLYIQAKNKVALIFQKLYEQPIFRKLRWNTKINMTRSEDTFIERFKRTYGPPDSVIVSFGDWEQRKGISYGKEPTKGKGMRKLLRKAGYIVYLKDEFRTSAICSKCIKGRTETFLKRKDPRPWKKDLSQKVWGLVRCQTCSALFQRDFNSAVNIHFLTQCFINEISIPIEFQRINFHVSAACKRGFG